MSCRNKYMDHIGKVEAISETGPDIVRLIIQIFTTVFEYENLMT